MDRHYLLCLLLILTAFSLYELQHTSCSCNHLSASIFCTDLYCARGAHGVLPMRLTGSQFNLQSLTPLSVAGRGRLQLGVAHLAISPALLKVVDN